MQVEAYLDNLPALHTWDGGATWNSGGFEREHLKPLHEFLRKELPEGSTLLETGCGNSTILMLLLEPKRLISIAPDAALFQRIREFCAKNQIADAALEPHVDGSQWVLPVLAAENRRSDPFLDFALIDGCHGWPTAFVDLEYANAMLREGGYVMVDDVQLHGLKEMARLLSEHEGFSLALDIGKSLVFRKLTAQRFLGEWHNQPYLIRRTKAYGQDWPNPFALGEPSALSKTRQWLGRLPQRIRGG